MLLVSHQQQGSWSSHRLVVRHINCIFDVAFKEVVFADPPNTAYGLLYAPCKALVQNGDHSPGLA